jgi:glutathione-regulated potassium-efflux system ancillary protein KefG
MADTQRKILILFAHPNQRMSEVGVPLAKAAREVEGVTLVDLYARYPDLNIDIDAEQTRLKAHDALIFLHPLYWYSVPAILKEWQDLVLEYGFAYGKGGTALQGKLFMSALTAGGREEAYGRKGYNNFTIRQILAPIEQTANLCGMVYLPPFTVFGSRSAQDAGVVPDIVTEWQRVLEAIREDNLPVDKAQKLDFLNEDLEHLLEGGRRWKLF